MVRMPVDIPSISLSSESEEEDESATESESEDEDEDEDKATLFLLGAIRLAALGEQWRRAQLGGSGRGVRRPALLNPSGALLPRPPLHLGRGAAPCAVNPP